MKRVFLIVLDSVGIGEMPDADQYGDQGSHTLAAAAASSHFFMPHMRELGLFNIEGVGCGERTYAPRAAFARMAEASRGKDTTIGHWEIAGLVSPKPLPTYPNGFPPEVLESFSAAVGRGVLCNRPYSGTEVIQDYGEEHMDSGKLIVYTSADSVFQIAAHEAVIPVPELYQICEKAREILQGEHGVGRVIARPFIGEPGHYTRTANRHDYSLLPPGKTMLNCMKEAGYTVAGVGKINDIFAGSGITEMIRTKGNEDGINQTEAYLKKDFEGLCFINLVDYDMLYGHRNDVDGYAKALTEFDKRLPKLLELLKEEDVLMITADHGCDPSTPSTDHSREYTPFLAYGQKVKAGMDLGTRDSFADIAATILDYFGISDRTAGQAMPIWKS
ncbi:MAG: phosphopentomutase [Lachnospiraceae bacterium]|nr:phosphopentomutase [Lachnospiraceae bacterium]